MKKLFRDGGEEVEQPETPETEAPKPPETEGGAAEARGYFM